jgi:hypothetical protein
MNTSPIPAAASFPSPAIANPGAAADCSDFHQVLQQLRPAAASGNGSSANADAPQTAAPPANATASARADVVPAQALTTAFRDFSPATPAATSAAIAGTNRSSAAGSAEANLLAGLTAPPPQSGATNVSPSAKIKQEDTVGKNSIGPNQDTKEAGDTGTPGTAKARTKSAANPIAVPAVVPSTPDSSAFSNALLVTAKAQQSASPQPSDNFTLEPAAMVAPIEPAAIVASTDVIRRRAATAATIGHTTDAFSVAASGGRPTATCAISATAPALVPEPTMRTASSTAAASASNTPSAKSKAKPQPAISFGKADSAGSSVTDTPDDATADRRTPSTRTAARENIVAGSSVTNQSVLRSSAELTFSQAPHSARTGSQMASLSSSATPDTQPKSDASSDRDASLISAASAVSVHPSGFQSAAGQPTWVAAAITPDVTSGAPAATQSMAAQSAAFAGPSPNSAPASTPPPAQVPAAAIPHPPPAVDSGQLRVTASTSELKISVQLPELGKVDVRAVTAHDVTTAHLTAFRHDALPVFAAERTGLEQALKSRDVILGSLNAHAQNSQAQGQSPGQQRQQGSPSAHSSDGTASLVTAATISATTEASNAGFLPDYSSISVRA